LFPGCPSGYTPSATNYNECEKCPAGWYSFGIQEACLECESDSEYDQVNNHYSSAVDQMCSEGNSISEAFTDTVRAISNETGLSMDTIRIILLSTLVPLAVCLLVPCVIGSVGLTVVVCCIVPGSVCGGTAGACYWLSGKKKKDQNRV
jgi:hypothetical protein